MALLLSQAAHTLGFTSVLLLVAVTLLALDTEVGSVDEGAEGGQHGEVLFVEEKVDLVLLGLPLVDTGSEVIRGEYPQLDSGGRVWLVSYCLIHKLLTYTFCTCISLHQINVWKNLSAISNSVCLECGYLFY